MDVSTVSNREWVREQGQAWERWSGVTKNAISGVESTISDAFQSIFEKGKSGSEKWAAIWRGMKSSMIRAVADIVAKQLMLAVANKITTKFVTAETAAISTQMKANIKAAAIKSGLAKVTGAQATASGANAVAAGVEAGAIGVLAGASTAAIVPTQTLAASIFFLAEAWKGYVGAIKAAAAVTTMTTTITAAMTAAKGMATGGAVAAAKGAYITKPTLVLSGEAGQNELFAPEIDFFNFSERLAYNIMRRQDEANAYRDYTANIIRQAASEESGFREKTTVVQNIYPIHDKRQVAAIVADWMKYHQKRV